MIWVSEQQELFYTALWGKYEAAEGKARIYPALAISYCKWWVGERARALEILHSLQQEFPEDPTLKLNALFVSIQAGKHETAIELLKTIAEADPRNLSQYYDLTLQLALHTGQTPLVRELVKNLLNSPLGARQLLGFSQKLRSGGFTQFAVAVSKKTTNLAMTARDPNFLRQLAGHLKDLGRGQETARLIERASRLERLHASARQTVLPGNMPSARQLERIREREAKLVQIAEKNPTAKSLENLAVFYKGRNQLAKAAETYKAAVALRPNDGNLRDNYAAMLQQSGQVKKAVEQYAILLRENPDTLQRTYYYYDNMIKIFIQAGEINQLVSVVKDMIDEKTPYGYRNEFARRVARHFIQSKNPKPAIDIYEKMLELGLDSVVHENLVSAYINTGEREKAIELLRERLKTDSVDVQVQVIRQMSEFNETRDDLKNLTAAYQAKLIEDTADPSTLYLLSVLKILADDVKTADSLVDKLLEVIPTDVRLRWLDTLASMYRDKSQPDRELRLHEASIAKVNLRDASHLSSIYRRLGTVYSEKGEKEKARNAIRKMGTLRLMEQRSGSIYWQKESVVRAYMEHEMWDEAEVLLTDLTNDLSVDHRHREHTQQQLLKIRGNRDGSDATTDAEKPIARMNVGFLRSKAQEHVNRNETPEAIETYKQILETVPEDLESQAQLASLYTTQNQHDAAIEIWNMLIQQDPVNTRYQDGLVGAYRAARKIPEAIKLAQDYIKDNPKVGLHYTRLAQLYVANGQTDGAITAYEKSIELAPGESTVYHELAKLYFEKNELEAAEKSFKAALQYAGQGGNRKEIEAQLLQLYQRQGKFEAVLKQAEEQGTLTFDMQKQRASIYRNEGETEKAITAYKKALEMASNTYARDDINRELMDIYSHLGKLEEFLKEAEEQGTLTFDMQKNIADRYRHIGEVEKAAKAYQRALELTTESHWRRQIERQIMDLYRQSGKMHEFLEEAEKAGTITYDQQMELAQHYSQKRQSEKAVEAFKKARNMTTDNSDREDISKFLMLEYARLGNSELAVKLYEEVALAEANDPNNLSTNYYSGSEGFKVHFPGDGMREILIQTYLRTGQLNQLQAIFEAKLEKTPETTHILEMVAEIYRRSNNHEKAAEVYQKLSEVAPSSVHYFYYAAASLNKIGKLELATEFLNRGTQALPKSPWKDKVTLPCGLGSICFQNKMYIPAIALFKEAVKMIEVDALNRNNNEWELRHLYELLGKCYLRTEQYEEAVTAYQQLADISPNDKERAEKAIKQAYRDGNLHEKRIPEQRKKVEANPDDIDARLALAQTYELSNKVDEAIAQYLKISELQPDVVKWHRTIAGLYEKSNQTDRAERLTKAAAAYEKALVFEPNSFELYDLLAKTHKNRDNSAEAAAVYRRALAAPLTSEEQDLAVKAILELTETDKRIAVLEELSTKTAQSVLLHKLLGDTYIESGNAEKAAQAYTKWLEIRQREKDHKHGSEYHQLAQQLLSKNVIPELALRLAKLAANNRADSTYLLTLGHAYLANEQYENALEQFQRSLNLSSQSGRLRGNPVEQLLKRVAEAGKHVKDKNGYVEMIGKLIETIPEPVGDKVNANLTLAEFCRELGMTDAAKTYVQKAGFFPETLWVTLGPFDNTKGRGYNTAYIPEETGQIDTSAKYDGVDGQVSWKQANDETFDGFFSFGDDEKQRVAYAYISFTVPEEREAQIKFDSDDQGKVWLNGKKVYAHRRTRGAQIDRRTIPVTLIAGKNTLMVKVCNETLPWGFYLRITDTEGNPFADLKLAK